MVPSSILSKNDLPHSVQVPWPWLEPLTPLRQQALMHQKVQPSPWRLNLVFLPKFQGCSSSTFTTPFLVATRLRFWTPALLSQWTQLLKPSFCFDHWQALTVEPKLTLDRGLLTHNCVLRSQGFIVFIGTFPWGFSKSPISTFEERQQKGSYSLLKRKGDKFLYRKMYSMLIRFSETWMHFMKNAVHQRPQKILWWVKEW